MNILNENEAIVINSLENWKKIKSVLEKEGYSWHFSYKPLKNTNYVLTPPCLVICCSEKQIGFTDNLDFKHDGVLIQDTDFIAKHSKNIFQEQMEAFYSQPLKQDKNMKIVVKKENGLLEVGKEYVLEKVLGTIDGCKFNFYYCKSDTQEIEAMAWQIDLWLKNGYIEEVKEVSYMFEDIWKASIENEECYDYTFEFSEMFMPLHKKQYEQTQAFAKLTHVRAKILKDHGYSEDWEADVNTEHVFPYWDIEKQEIVVSFPIKNSVKYGNEITFPNTNLLIKALQHNQELFKTYLGV